MPTVFVFGALMGEPHVLATGRPAVLDDHAVRFTARGFPWLEPCFAALEPAPGACAHGVIFEVEPAAWRDMAAHESGYTAHEVVVRVDEGTLRAVALLLNTDERAPEGVPSARYGRILAEAAAHHGLPHPVVARYRDLADRGSRITLWFGPLVGPVRALTARIGFAPAMGVTLAVPLLVVALGLGWLVG